MGLDIWFTEDIRNALLAANEASAATAAVIAELVREEQGASTEWLAVSLRAYRQGYTAALATVALAFGIVPQEVTLTGFRLCPEGLCQPSAAVPSPKGRGYPGNQKSPAHPLKQEYQVEEP